MSVPRYEDCVFLNVPFDKGYEPIFRALVFTIHDCGFLARCAREVDDGGQVRLDTIYELILSSQYGIHDLSRTGLDRAHRLPRFNMPLELGIFLGAKRFGDDGQKKKHCLILDRDPYRYQRFCSDISGHDIRAHSNRIDGVVRNVRNWFSNLLTRQDVQIPGPSRMESRYEQFRRELPMMCSKLALEPGELIFREYTKLVVAWLKANPK